MPNAPSAKEVLLAAAFIYGNDDVNLQLSGTEDELEAQLSRSEHGAWVRAWLYIPYEAIERETDGH